MIENLDQRLFLLINSAYSPFWDKVMHFLSMVLVWVPLYLLIVVCLVKKYKRKFIAIFITIALAVGITDQAALIFKNNIGRLRPCHEPSLQGLVHLVDNKCGGRYGFVSSHAANSFNIALLSLLLIRKRWFAVFIIVWASAISYSRIYLGVHYPGDVVCGAALGAAVGWLMVTLYFVTDRKFLSHKEFFN